MADDDRGPETAFVRQMNHAVEVVVSDTVAKQLG
jgi:hypothetical protein